MNSVQVLDKVCLYNTINDETTLYGHSCTKFNTVLVNNNVVPCVLNTGKPDFFIKLQ